VYDRLVIFPAEPRWKGVSQNHTREPFVYHFFSEPDDDRFSGQRCSAT
jgi:hypothetical protein